MYLLIEEKLENAYEYVLKIFMEWAKSLGVILWHPAIVMSDFELAIINTVQRVFGLDKTRCFFHLTQSIYRFMQKREMEAQYATAENSRTRDSVRLLSVLAFLPTDDIPNRFAKLEKAMPCKIADFYQYFGHMYVGSVSSSGGGRRRGDGNKEEDQQQITPLRYNPYAFVVELIKEEANSEIMMWQLQLGQHVRKGQDNSRKKMDEI